MTPGTAARWLQVADLFPWTSLNNASHLSLTPSQLFLGLTDHYDPNTHVEYLEVRSVWYGKCREGARHEFLLIEIEDTVTKMVNFLVLDKSNTENANIGSGREVARLVLGFRALKGLKIDVFRISRDGDEDQLMIDCKLKPRVYLQKLEPTPEKPLFLYQLATLAFVVSRDYPTYSADVHNCYFFAGLMWAGIRKFCPKAVVTNRHGELKGKLGPLLYVLDEDEINMVYKAFQAQMDIVNSKLAQGRLDWTRLKSEASGLRPARKGSSESWPEPLFPKKSRPSRMATIEDLTGEEDEKLEVADEPRVVPTASSQLSVLRRSRARFRSFTKLRHKEK